MELRDRSGDIIDTTVEDWKVIGSGGFGQIYKARHRSWGCDVAIKLLHYDGDCSSLRQEFEMMCQARNPYVIHVHGMFEGRPPFPGSSLQLGVVMEFMERGSLFSLQKTLESPLPWPLSVRLTHQVALGMNFLHNLSPAVLHLDLKPSNVLLDSSLNAKLTDFGLATFSHSISQRSRKSSKQEGGTISYMPPEAFKLSYSPTKASDVYSYGVLLWSIVTGKQPYPYAQSSLVRFRVPEGDRPSMDEVKCLDKGCAGMSTLIDLMQRCWETKSNLRPDALTCTLATEELFKMHKHTIADAVHQVLKKLEREWDRPDSSQVKDANGEEQVLDQFQKMSFTHPSVPAREGPVNISNEVLTGPLPVQETPNGGTPNHKEKIRQKELSAGILGYPQQVESPQSSRNLKTKPSCDLSHAPLLNSSVMNSPKHNAGQMWPPQHPLLPPYQRQFSSPTNGVRIHLSNAHYIQIGQHNNMVIGSRDNMERKRHPTAPSAVPMTPNHTK